MDATIQNERFAAIYAAKAKADALDAEAEQQRLREIEENEKPLIGMLDKGLRRLGILNDGDGPLTGNGWLEGDFHFAMTSYQYGGKTHFNLEILALRTEDLDAQDQIVRVIDTEQLLADNLSVEALGQIQTTVASYLEDMTRSYAWLQDRLKGLAEIKERPSVVALDFLAGSDNELKTFGDRANDLVKTGYKPVCMTGAATSLVVVALFVLDGD